MLLNINDLAINSNGINNSNSYSKPNSSGLDDRNTDSENDNDNVRVERIHNR